MADYFALLAFAGELATSYGLTGWEQNTAYTAIALGVWRVDQITRYNRQHRRSKTSTQVRRWFENNQHRFEELPIRGNTRARRSNPAGYVEHGDLYTNRKSEGSNLRAARLALSVYFVYRNTWREEVLAGLDTRKANAFGGARHSWNGAMGEYSGTKNRSKQRAKTSVISRCCLLSGAAMMNDCNDGFSNWINKLPTESSPREGAESRYPRPPPTHSPTEKHSQHVDLKGSPRLPDSPGHF